jgi:RNA processing factor Prp31
MVINKVIATVDIDGNVLTMRLAEWYTNCRRF